MISRDSSIHNSHKLYVIQTRIKCWCFQGKFRAYFVCSGFALVKRTIVKSTDKFLGLLGTQLGDNIIVQQFCLPT